MIEYTIPKELRGMPMDVRPNLFIPGFAKSGTTALVEYLKQHKDIYVPKKELHTLYNFEHFPSWMDGEKISFAKKIYTVASDRYVKLYSNAKNYKYRLDASPSYTYNIDVAPIIKQFNPSSRIILVIREQKRRLVSSYFYSYANHKKDFIDYINDYLIPEIETFLYYRKIIIYYKLFGDNVRIIKQEDLSKDPYTILDLLFEYLQIDSINIKPIISNSSIIFNENNFKANLLKILLLIGNIIYRNISVPLRLVDLHVQVSNIIRSKFISRFIASDKKLVQTFINKIPSNVRDILEEDYENSIKYCKRHGLLLPYNSN